MTDIDKLIERLKDHAEAWEVKETDNRDELMNERVMAFDCLTALEEIQRLRAIEAAAKTWMEWGGHCPTCAFVRHREGNPLLSTELLWDYCDCGWHAARAALAAKET
jgi:hypothetical protein